MREMENESMKEMESKEMEEATELEAAADSISLQEDAGNINDRIPYVIPLEKEYDLDGKKIKEVDLSGLEDLTTLDAQEIDSVMSKMKYYPQNKFKDILYTKHIAMRATGLPVEFFNSLSFKDMQSITSRVAIYFLY